jgi:hypothetical protein
MGAREIESMFTSSKASQSTGGTGRSGHCDSKCVGFFFHIKFFQFSADIQTLAL